MPPLLFPQPLYQQPPSSRPPMAHLPHTHLSIRHLHMLRFAKYPYCSPRHLLLLLGKRLGFLIRHPQNLSGQRLQLLASNESSWQKNDCGPPCTCNNSSHPHFPKISGSITPFSHSFLSLAIHLCTFQNPLNPPIASAKSLIPIVIPVTAIFFFSHLPCTWARHQ
jgi:hypothetical protein